MGILRKGCEQETGLACCVRRREKEELMGGLFISQLYVQSGMAQR